MQYKIGDNYQGKDCNNVEIEGKVIKILKRTLVIENGTEYYLVKKISKKK